MVPCLHAGIFLVPLVMRAFLPDGHSGAWLTVFTLETILYAVGTAFMMLMVKDHHVHVYRIAASTDHLTGVLNRGAFIETARTFCKRQAKRGEPVAVLRAKAPRNAPDSSPQRDQHVPVWHAGICAYSDRNKS